MNFVRSPLVEHDEYLTTDKHTIVSYGWKYTNDDDENVYKIMFKYNEQNV